MTHQEAWNIGVFYDFLTKCLKSCWNHLPYGDGISDLLVDSSRVNFFHHLSPFTVWVPLSQAVRASASFRTYYSVKLCLWVCSCWVSPSNRIFGCVVVESLLHRNCPVLVFSPCLFYSSSSPVWVFISSFNDTTFPSSDWSWSLRLSILSSLFFS